MRDRWWRLKDVAEYYVKPGEDGYPHERNERGWCTTCMAPPGCSHARCAQPSPTMEDA